VLWGVLQMPYFGRSAFALGAPPLCCSVLQCVAVCCSVLQCIAVCCKELQIPYHSRSLSVIGALGVHPNTGARVEHQYDSFIFVI